MLLITAKAWKAFFNDYKNKISTDYIILSKNYSLEKDLALLNNDTVTFCGLWDELTVNNAFILSYWGSESAQRSFGFALADVFVCQQFEQEQREPESQNLISSIGDAENFKIFIKEGYIKIDESPLDSYKLLQEKLPLALIITGHGGEYCISCGEDCWLTTYHTPSLKGRQLTSNVLTSKVVFLNTCSSLRLGDSIVPRQYSLASALYQNGSSIIGSFRNFITSPNLPSYFANSVASGFDLGQVTNHLNRALIKLGLMPSLCLLGDRSMKLPQFKFQISTLENDQRTDYFQTVLKELLFIICFHQVISMWSLITLTVYNSYETILHFYTLILKIENRNLKKFFSHNEFDTIHKRVLSAIDDYKLSIMSELIKVTGNGKWIQSVIAGINNFSLESTKRCSKCSNRLSVYKCKSTINARFSFTSEECDACGTTFDWLGTFAPTPRQISVTLSQTAICVAIAKNSNYGKGLIFIHRARLFLPIYCDSNGGYFEIQKEIIPHRGKVTIGSIFFNSSNLAIIYRHIFVPFNF